MHTKPVTICSTWTSFLILQVLVFTQFKLDSSLFETSGRSSNNKVMPIKRRKRPALTETLFVSTRNTLRSGAGVKKMMYAEA